MRCDGELGVQENRGFIIITNERKRKIDGLQSLLSILVSVVCHGRVEWTPLFTVARYLIVRIEGIGAVL